jgi:hypothetical protein
MNKKLKVWLKANSACNPGLDSMIENKITDMRDAYNRAEPEYLVWAITREGVMAQRDCVRFALFCVQQVQDKLTDERSKAVIPALKGWIDGTVSDAEMEKVRAAACAARAAACAARADVYVADAATCAYYVAADAAETRKAQAEWIRANVPFEALKLEVTE